MLSKKRRPFSFKFKPIFILFLLLFNFAHSTYNQQGYKLMDPHYYKNKFNILSNQQTNKECSLKDGPNCYFISKFPSKEHLPKVFNDFNLKNTKLALVNHYLNNKAKEVEKNNNKSPLVVMENGQNMSLMLTFESFDYKTEQGDIYMPDELILSSSAPAIKLITTGRLRLRNNKEGNENMKNTYPHKTSTFLPSNTFGISETTVIMSLNQKFYFSSLYARCGAKYYNRFSMKFSVKGISDNKMLYSKEQMLECGYKNPWKKIQGNLNLPVEKIEIPEGFEIDNVSLIYIDKNIDPYSFDFKSSKVGLDKNVQEKINELIKELMEKGELGGVKVVNLEEIIGNNGN